MTSNNSSKLILDVGANLTSLFILFVAGILINVIIGRNYGPGDLGLFNIVFAIFILFSQIGSFGLQYSTLSFISANQTDPAARTQILRDALRVGLVTSSGATAIAVLLTPVLEAIFDLDGLAAAWLLALPGLWCFAINKVLLAYLNGLGHMRWFAFFQSTRYIAMLAAVAALSAAGADGKILSVILSIAECLLLLSMLPIAVTAFRSIPLEQQASWRQRHVRFGLFAMPSGAVAELNTRVDVLLIGAILGGAQTGYYSIAILLAEGYGQAVFVIRNVLNPMLAKIVLERDQEGLSRLVRMFGALTLALMVVGGAILIAAFPLFNAYILIERFSEAQLPLTILVVGIGLTAPWMIFTMILPQGGRPGYYTVLMVLILAFNIVLNFVGINMLGLVGAAIGTSLSFVAGAVTLSILVKRVFGLRLWIR